MLMLGIIDGMLESKRSYLLPTVLLVVLLLAGCGQPATIEAGQTLAATPLRQLSQYWTPTPTQTPSPPTPLAPIPATPAPTPTPFTHTIAKGDMLGTIAFRYGVTVDDLMAANPGVDPGFLTIGEELIVPIEGDEPSALATATPMAIMVEEPDCYLTSEEGAWCLVLATNNEEETVENISARVGLFSPEGESLGSDVAVTPLNILPSGSSLPMLVFFPLPQLDEVIPQAEILTAFTVPEDDERYLDAGVEVHEVEVDESGLHASLKGVVTIPAGSQPPAYLWLAAVAYTEEGEVVGVRKWEAPMGETCVDMGYGGLAGVKENEQVGCIPFDLTIFSLGLEIGRVEVVVEARQAERP